MHFEALPARHLHQDIFSSTGKSVGRREVVGGRRETHEDGVGWGGSSCVRESARSRYLAGTPQDRLCHEDKDG